MRALHFAWLSTVRQPARSLLGILGVAAVGALLFDMLLLSRGLVLSFQDLLDRAGFDIRITATDATLFSGPQIGNAAAMADALAQLPEVDAVLPLHALTVEAARDNRTAAGDRIAFLGVDPMARPLWTILDGADLPRTSTAAAVVVNRNLAASEGLAPGSQLRLRGTCGGAALPPVAFEVVGIADFPFDDAAARSVGGTLDAVRQLCGVAASDSVDILLVRSRPGTGADMAAAAIRATAPALHVATNEDLVQRFSRVEFSYFRQISAVLATVTLFFGFLLIAVLLTVSVNQRLGEIAALRAVGLSRARVVAGVLWESVLLVGTGGILAIPLGAALSWWLDDILRAMPGVPAALHFFVFEPRVLVLHVVLLAAASFVAALYPMVLVASLPIAGTLRREVVS